MNCPVCNTPVTVYRNPVPTVDIIVELHGGIVLIERKNEPLGWALPGGFVDYGESFEAAACREAKEETGLEVTLREQFYTYSDPQRDARQHNSSTVYIATAQGEPVGADDAVQARVFHKGNLPHLVFDHRQIVEDYFHYIRTGKRPPVMR